MNRSEIIILLIAAVISGVKWMMERGKEEAQPKADEEHRRRLSEMRREKAGQSAETPSANAEEERLRKFMEALGLPPTAPPPVHRPIQKPAPPPAVAPPPIHPAAPPARTFEPKPIAAPSLERVPAKEKPVAPVRAEAPTVSPIMPSAEADAAEAAAFAIPTSRQPLGKVRSERRQEKLVNFSNRRALRSAFVMSEILGQPKGLR